MSDPSPSFEPAPAVPVPAGWQPLPLRGAVLAGAIAVLGVLVPCFGAGIGLRLGARVSLSWPLTLVFVALLALLFGVLVYRRRRRVRWLLDAQGLAVRRGNLWQSETRVPASRVQHLDLRRGPLERLFGLATLVVHTAGSRFGAVSLAGLASEDAERLRERLSRQLDQDDDAL